jgi:hypothetical protein
MRPFVVLALLALVGVVGVLAAVQLTLPIAPHWSNPAAHVIDGRWFGAETACPLDARQECSPAVDSALERVAIIEPEATVTSASVTEPVGGYTTERDETILATTGGWVDYKIAVLNLSDGRRLMIGVVCAPEMEYASGTVPPRCDWDAGEITAPRVGAEPWLNSD